MPPNLFYFIMVPNGPHDNQGFTSFAWPKVSCGITMNNNILDCHGSTRLIKRKRQRRGTCYLFIFSEEYYSGFA